MRGMSEMAEWSALVAEALTIQESAEDKQRRLRQLERDILLADLTAKESRGCWALVYDAAQMDSARD